MTIELPAPEPQIIDIPNPLMKWADGARAAAAIAKSLARTPFVPASLRDGGGVRDKVENIEITASNVTAAILTGQEIGISPMAALRSIDIIKGTPAMRAHALRGLVQSRGHQVWVEDSTTTRAVVCGQRRGSEQVQKSTWTIERAKSMKLVGKTSADRDQWVLQPQTMLVARATAEICRLIASDVLIGIPYAVEELDDDVQGVGESAPGKRKTVQRKPLTPAHEVETATPEPEAPAALEAVPVVDPDNDESTWPEPPADWEPGK